MTKPVRGILAAALLWCAGAAPARAAWRSDTPLPVSYLMTQSVAGGGFLYKIGGLGDKGICGASDVLYAPLAADGTIGAWNATASLPSVGDSTVTVTCGSSNFQLSNVVIGWGYSAAYANGFVYVLGGNLWNFNGFPDGAMIHFSSAVYYARANADGSLGAWRRAADLPDANYYGSAAVSGGFLYLTGGRDAAGTTFVSRGVLYAALNADGSLGPWKTAGAQMPGGLWLQAAAADAGRLYVAGGVTYDPLPRDQITNAVYSAPLDAATGDLGAWRAESSLPVGLAGHGLEVRHGVLYTVAGEEPNYPSVSVHQAGVNPDGTLAPWTDAPALPVPLYLHGSAAFGGTVYALGGSDGSMAQKAVYALPDQTAPAAIADLAATPAGSDTLSLTWTAPGNDGAYGSVSGGQYRLSVAPDAAALAAATPVVWTSTFAAGEAQAWTLNGLSAGTTYFLSLSAVDEAGNAGPASNVASTQTYFLAVSTEATPVASLESPVPGLTIAAAAAPAPLPFVAVSPVYRISPAAALNPGLLTISFASKDLSAGLALFAWDGTAWSSAAVSGQAVDATAHDASGDLARTGLVVLLDALRTPAPGPAPSPEAVSYDAVFAPSTLERRGRGPLTAAVPALMGRRGLVQSGSVSLIEVDGAAVAPVPALAAATGPFGDDDARGRGDGRGRAFGERGGHRFGPPDGLFRFDASAVAARLTPGEHRATIAGTLADGRAFRATGTLRLKGDEDSAPVARRDDERFWPAPACLLALKEGSSADSVPFPIHGRSNARDARAVTRGRMEVQVPSGAVDASVELTISSTAADAQPDRATRERKTETEGLTPVSAPVVFGPEGTQFAKPVTIQLPYDPALLPAGTGESSLTARYWNPRTQQWETMPSTVDRAAHLVIAQTTHFSLYQVLAAPATGAPAAAASPDFSLRAAYAFPNPVRGAGVVTFRVQPGLADSVSVRVYDLSGRRIHASSEFALQVLDDGNGLGAQYTYDHAWDVSGVASGVYFYVITATKAGSADVHKSGRVAVIK